MIYPIQFIAFLYRKARNAVSSRAARTKGVETSPTLLVRPNSGSEDIYLMVQARIAMDAKEARR